MDAETLKIKTDRLVRLAKYTYYGLPEDSFKLMNKTSGDFSPCPAYFRAFVTFWEDEFSSWFYDRPAARPWCNSIIKNFALEYYAFDDYSRENYFAWPITEAELANYRAAVKKQNPIGAPGYFDRKEGPLAGFLRFIIDGDIFQVLNDLKQCPRPECKKWHSRRSETCSPACKKAMERSRKR